MALTPALPFDEAQARLLAFCAPLGAERLAPGDSLGRYLAEPLLARRDQPPADLSAMDGYALSAKPGPWTLVGESAAGHPFFRPLAAGEAVRISTGAVMPEGADQVLLQEEAEVAEGRVAIATGGEASARHIRRRGFDFSVGDIVLPQGALIGPAQLALALAAGHGASAIGVGRLPSVAIIDSGDELCDDPENLAEGQIPASNGAMLAAMAAPYARSVARIGPVPDRLDALLKALEATDGADVVITSGGASVGDHDLIRPALEAWGAAIDFWRIAMRPGKPLLVARHKSQLILGLPGNPVSSYVTAFHFVLPALRALAGSVAPLAGHVLLPLGGPMPAGGDRCEFMRATLDRGRIVPMPLRDSSALATLGLAQALIRREPHAPPAEAGDLVVAYLLHNGGTA